MTPWIRFEFRIQGSVGGAEFLGQFPNVQKPEIITNALKNIGFDDVFEVARGADIVSELTRRKLAEKTVPGR